MSDERIPLCRYEIGFIVHEDEPLELWEHATPTDATDATRRIVIGHETAEAALAFWKMVTEHSTGYLQSLALGTVEGCEIQAEKQRKLQ